MYLEIKWKLQKWENLLDIYNVIDQHLVYVYMYKIININI